MVHAPICVLGGTFDPIHFGHLRLAQELADVAGAGRVLFIPAGVPPHRAAPHASAAQRLEMVRLAVAGNPRFAVDDRELKRGGASYTVDTLATLRDELGAARPLCLLLGSDAFAALPTWHRWEALFDLAHIMVAHRPGARHAGWDECMPQALRAEYRKRLCDDPAGLRGAPAGSILAHAIAALDISATAIRDGVRCGASPRYLLPDSVLDYIQANSVYAGG
ncbi:MAG TPA: nicotinate-nucleotide adenylyltransferase [Burkholderiales bacterium]|nr:nicotinate-nucleotide adenylyltransferase [Burkholderiales bacterium]